MYLSYHSDCSTYLQIPSERYVGYPPVFEKHRAAAINILMSHLVIFHLRDKVSERRKSLDFSLVHLYGVLQRPARFSPRHPKVLLEMGFGIVSRRTRIS